MFIFESSLKLGIPFYIYVKHGERVSKVLVKKHLALDADESKALKKAFEAVLAKYQILDNLDPSLNLALIITSIIATRVTTGVNSILEEIKYKQEVDEYKRKIAELEKQLKQKRPVVSEQEAKEDEKEEVEKVNTLPPIAPKARATRGRKPK